MLTYYTLRINDGNTYNIMFIYIILHNITSLTYCDFNADKIQYIIKDTIMLTKYLQINPFDYILSTYDYYIIIYCIIKIICNLHTICVK